MTDKTTEIHIGDTPRGAVVVRLHNGHAAVFQGATCQGIRLVERVDLVNGTTHQVGDLSLRAASAAKIADAMHVIQHAFDASPSGRPVALRHQHDELSAALRDAHDQAYQTDHDFIASDGLVGGGRRAKARAELDAARRALAAFEEAHPEVKSAVEAELALAKAKRREEVRAIVERN